MSDERGERLMAALEADPEWQQQVAESGRAWDALACWVIAANDDLKVVRDVLEDRRNSNESLGIVVRSRLRHWLACMPNADTITSEELRAAVEASRTDAKRCGKP